MSGDVQRHDWNVGVVEATLRVAAAAVLLSGVVLYMVVSPSWVALALFILVGVVGALLVRSAATRYCPIHTRLGIGTTRSED